MVAPVFLRVKRQDLPADYRNYDESGGLPRCRRAAGSRCPCAGIGVAALRVRARAAPGGRRVHEREPDVVPRRHLHEPRAARARRAPASRSRAPWRGGALRRGASSGRGATTPTTSTRSRAARSRGSATRTSRATASASRPGRARAGRPRASTLGGALRYVPALELSGEQELPVARGSRGPSRPRAQAGWEGGLSARLAVTEAFRVLASLGGRTAQAWDGFGVTAGPRGELERRARLRRRSSSPGRSASAWARSSRTACPSRARACSPGTGLEARRAAAGRGRCCAARSRARARPTSYDDRVVASATVGF